MIIFLHFHKAAGMSIVEFFRRSGYRFHYHNRNANPWDKKKPIYFWRFETEKLKEWISTRKKCNFIACEWNFMKPHVMNSMTESSDVTLVTCLRDPWKRYLSNYLYEPDRQLPKSILVPRNRIRQGRVVDEHYILDFSKVNIMRDKRGLRLRMNYNKDNYYVRMLNGMGEDWNTKITSEHLRIAKSVLAKFDVIIVIEIPESFRQLRRFSKRRNLGHAHPGRYQKPKVSQSLIDEFKKRNYYDYQLYEFAKKLVTRK